MIGVFCRESENEMVREFFELFKTPWERLVSGKRYDVVISTRYETPPADAAVMIIYSTVLTEIDSLCNISLGPLAVKYLKDRDGKEIPIYRTAVRIEGCGEPLLRNGSGVAAMELAYAKGSVIRVGFDLFAEVATLLGGGQPPENALIPALEYHIELLRQWITDSGILWVEIPPVPAGCSFIACLTHDVDHAGIRYYKADHTMWGFVYRASIGSLVSYVRHRFPLDRLFRNLRAVFSLPLVYAGICDDFWDHLEAYAEMEGECKGTFFVIPFKSRGGDKLHGGQARLRATGYDVEDICEKVKELASKGFEIGLHGIDAWHSVEKGKEEVKRITKTTGHEQIGVRMHWLCFDSASPAVLDRIGFDYDASCGFNEAVGCKAGTMQVFKPAGVVQLLELPLNIQDTSLFFPGRLGLTEKRAWDVCATLLDAACQYGGVVTVSWHDRSMAPERLWGEFYKRLLGELWDRGAWFGTASQVVRWFRQRRSVVFEDCFRDAKTLRLKLRYEGCGEPDKLLLRVHMPRTNAGMEPKRECSCFDIRYSGERLLEIPLNCS